MYMYSICTSTPLSSRRVVSRWRYRSSSPTIGELRRSHSRSARARPAFARPRHLPALTFQSVPAQRGTLSRPEPTHSFRSGIIAPAAKGTVTAGSSPSTHAPALRCTGSTVNTPTFPAGSIASRILRVRGHKVMLDADLADLYGVPTKALVQAVKRNRGRFPSDFMLQLTEQEVAILKSQTVTSSPTRELAAQPDPKPKRRIGFVSGD